MKLAFSKAHHGAMLAGLLWLAIPAIAAAQADPYLRPARAPEPADNKATPQRVELGARLFFDPRLSSSDWMSCATCHNPALGWSDGLKRARGRADFARATPSLVNAAFSTSLMWDGSAASFEDQALIAIAAPEGMNQDPAALAAKLGRVRGYREMFAAAYPDEGLTARTIAKALASFERTVLSGDSPFDRWRRGDKDAMSAPAKRGFAIFTGKAGCTGCHQGFSFTDNALHDAAVKGPDALVRTPTLRDIGRTAPYMHNGVYATLEQVVDHYDRGGDGRSSEIRPLGLSGPEKADLVRFLKSLTGAPRAVPRPVLPG